MLEHVTVVNAIDMRLRSRAQHGAKHDTTPNRAVWTIHILEDPSLQRFVDKGCLTLVDLRRTCYSGNSFCSSQGMQFHTSATAGHASDHMVNI